MLHKLFSIVLLGLTLVASGCCCGPRGRVWNCDMADCGDASCGSCGHGGVKGIFAGRKGSCMGCGEVYLGEWRSDPPPCQDPCTDGSCGARACGHCGVAGCHGACLGNLFSGLRGYRHYPGPCGIEPCGGSCGVGGCSTCGIGGGTHRAVRGMGYSESLLEQDWNPEPAPAPVPGKPIHKAAAPTQRKVSQAKPGAVLYGRQVSSSAVRQAGYDR